MPDDFPHATPEAGEEAAREVFQLNRTLLDKHKITFDYLAKKLKKELNAKFSRLLVVKSAGKAFAGFGNDTLHPPDPRGKGVKGPHNGNGGSNGKGTKRLWEGETIFSQHGSHHHEIHAVHQVDWGTRQRARIDAHKLRGDYPAEKKEIGGKNGGPLEVIIRDRFERGEDESSPDPV